MTETIQYGLTLTNQRLIQEKAKTKKDGCYRFRGVVYSVIDGFARLFVTNKEIIECAYGFNVVIGYVAQGQDQMKVAKEATKQWRKEPC